MTASTLYEAVEPQIIWKHLLTTVVSELLSDGSLFEVCILPTMTSLPHLMHNEGNPFGSVYSEDIHTR
jgi:hypothetical protein